jgi:hypothetical protein
MKEVIVFGVGTIVGGAAATLFTNRLRDEIRLVTNKFHTLVLRIEAVVQRLEAKL